jgi:hypothetical protein
VSLSRVMPHSKPVRMHVAEPGCEASVQCLLLAACNSFIGRAGIGMPWLVAMLGVQTHRHSGMHNAHGSVQVVVYLFKKLGPTFMSKLKGSFAFVVYDARVGRVLAVCDRTATFSLWQAHLSSDNTLVIACNMDAPPAPAMLERNVVGAGEYKFGWRSMPLAYMASNDAVKSRCEEARSAAMQALLVRPPRCRVRCPCHTACLTTVCKSPLQIFGVLSPAITDSSGLR